ncbi:MAG: helix-turn-helix transcriptional regulator [Candidatus Aminicenantes bacterium]|nr:helix-turn-helix transcriptional regulator [Candidatus Aminicenantes bacterium]
MISKALIAASTKPLILSVLLDGETYGYRIIKQMKALSGGRLEWSFGMLYPVLHRLEKDGFIEASWKKSDKGRLRKYYRLTEAGQEELDRERSQWLTVQGVFAKLWPSSEVRS